MSLERPVLTQLLLAKTAAVRKVYSVYLLAIGFFALKSENQVRKQAFFGVGKNGNRESKYVCGN